MKELRSIVGISDHVIESKDSSGAWIAKVIVASHAMHFKVVDGRVRLAQNATRSLSLGNKRNSLIMQAEGMAQRAYEANHSNKK